MTPPLPASPARREGVGEHDSDAAIWGLPEAGVAWITANIASVLAVVGIVAIGGWSLFTPARPGGFVGRTAAQVANGEDLTNESWPFLWQQVALIPLWLGLLGTAWLLAGALGKARPGWRISVEPADVPLGVAAGILLQVPLIPILYTIVQAIFGDIQQSTRAQVLTDRVDSPPKVIVLFVFVAIGAPIVEELFYRGLVQRSLVARLGPAFGIAVSALIFGIVHFSLIELPAQVMIGAVLGVLAWRTGRLGPAIICHMTFNSFTLIALLAS